ncbi:hypothetical protein MRX96_027401 [Rhipicephalus microplus]
MHAGSTGKCARRLLRWNAIPHRGAIGCLFAESYALYKRKRGTFPSKATRQHGREWAVRDRDKRIIPRPIRGDSEQRHSSLDGRRRQCSRASPEDARAVALAKESANRPEIFPVLHRTRKI